MLYLHRLSNLNIIQLFEEAFYRTTECDEYYVCDWSGSDYHHSVHTFWKKNQKQMQPVLDAIGQIKDQNLEYETSCSAYQRV